MKVHIWRSAACACAASLFLLGNMPIAQAQLNNKPYSFPSSPSGVGMSSGGKQALINNELFGTTPDNLIRAPGSGELLDVVRTPGRSAIVSRSGTNEFIAGYRGSSYKGDNFEMSAGTFNGFFSPTQSKSSGINFTRFQSGAMVNTWTGRVVSNGPVSYSPRSSVDNWTSLVYSGGY